MFASLVETGLAAWWAPGLAFAAGVVSFASPCVLPLVPGYLSFVSGTGGGDRVALTSRPLAPILLFVAGFAVVFTALGAFAGALLPIVRSPVGIRVAGLIVVAFGVVMILYALRLGGPGLYAERRPFLSRIAPGKATAFPLGMAFAAGWTPCIGPVLAGILGIASAQGGSIEGGILLFSYSLGLGLPFLLVGLGVSRLVRGMDVLKRNYHWIAGVSGAVMVTVGLLLVSGLWVRLLAPLLRLVNRFEPPI